METANSDGKKSRWDSLEVVKLMASILTPLILLWFGSQFNSLSVRHAQIREREAQVIRKRIELWDKMGKSINDMYCYFFQAGNVNELTPDGIIKTKVELDTTIYTYRPFLSDEFFERYRRFIKAAFIDHGTEVYLRSRPLRKHDNEVSAASFTNEDNEREIYDAYYSLMQHVAKELDVPLSKPEYEFIPGRGTKGRENEGEH